MPVFVRQYPHQSLSNLAHYHRSVIRAKVAAGSSEALALDCTSFLIALAFSVEAFVNFVGSKKVAGWKERASYKAKMATLAERLKLTIDESQEPYTTLNLLKSVRDQMAHGKPVEFTAEAEPKKLGELLAPVWDRYCYPEFVEHVYTQVSEFERHYIAAAKIKPSAMLSSAMGYARI